MIDLREEIIARLVDVCAGITGIAAVARSKLDVPDLVRPAIIINGGAEQLLSEPRTVPRGPKKMTRQQMELSPAIILLVRGDSQTEPAPLMSLYRNRIIQAVMNDATLDALVTNIGGIRYEGCSEPAMEPESKEPRLEIQIVFTYPLRLADLI